MLRTGARTTASILVEQEGRNSAALHVSAFQDEGDNSLLQEELELEKDRKTVALDQGIENLKIEEDDLKQNEFEWFVDFSHVEPVWRRFLDQHGFKVGELSALVIGCGTSGMSASLCSEGICQFVHSVDILSDRVAFLEKRYEGVPGLSWSVCDVNDIESLNKILGEQRFDLVIDKGTLDAMLCDVSCAGYLKAIEKFLNCGGALLCVSLYSSNLLERLLNSDVMNRSFSFACEEFLVDKVQWSSVTLVDSRRTSADVECDIFRSGKCFCKQKSAALQTYHNHIQETLLWYHQEECPLLTEERDFELRSAFDRVGHPVTIETAYNLIFTWVERQDYLFEDFLADWNDSVGLSRSTVTYEDAVKFLCSNQ